MEVQGKEMEENKGSTNRKTRRIVKRMKDKRDGVDVDEDKMGEGVRRNPHPSKNYTSLSSHLPLLHHTPKIG
ncbi:hypothetical protein Pmani_032692 [Petrolisthes manimaculis]|uniref:Uncharacterized protein n=1 Tax=Petrolisthes manimaculis TaxID=1843537 RepID=A0AAE1NS51_9EUCA|nr:hypothetical protein Pmani_032692 [Petrolisthes manimaculis]